MGNIRIIGVTPDMGDTHLHFYIYKTTITV